MSDSAPAAASDSGTAGDSSKPARSGPAKDAAQGGLIARLGLFLRQIVAELKKVVRPTRSELVTYTSVVVVFVMIVMAFVTGLDQLIGRVTLLVFG